MKTNPLNDHRTVLTLDAGGTNFVFSAIRAGEIVTEAVSRPANADNLDKCLAGMVEGFEAVIARLDEKPVAISFAFPGPADYPHGIIGGYLPNFPSFRDGVALGDFLNRKFHIPVFINNDGDLYAYGEALAGKLPEVNERVRSLGGVKEYKNLIGYTFGTGFGIGIVADGRLHIGDNSCVETFCLPHRLNKNLIVEEGVSARAVIRVYREQSGDERTGLTPKDIFDIAEGTAEGNQDAARRAFATMGEVAGDAMATAVTLIDGIIVIGGGVIAAKKYIMPSLLKVMRSKIHTIGGEEVGRVQMNVYDLDDEKEFALFAKGQKKALKVYGTDEKVDYDPEKRIGVCVSTIGATRAISLGAAAYALNSIDSQ